MAHRHTAWPGLGGCAEGREEGHDLAEHFVELGSSR